MGLIAFLRANARWLAAGALMSFLSSFGQTYFIGVFAGEIRADFGLSHSAWGTLYAAATTVSAGVMVWAGALTDRFRARAMAAAVLVLLAAACTLMAVNRVWLLLPVTIFLLRFSGQGMLSQIAIVSMSRWFVAARGRALSLAALGFALGEALLPMTLVALMPVVGWRSLWLVAAAVALAMIPVLALLLRHERTPQSMAETSHAAGMDGLHWTRRMVLRHWLFWLVIPALMGPPAFNTAFFFQQVQFAEVKGWAHLDLVRLFPLYTATGVASTLLSGWALDRFGVRRIMPWYLLPIAGAFAVFSLAPTPAAMIPGLLLLGMTNGTLATLPSTFFASHYGTRHLGAIKALTMAVLVLGSAIGPGLSGVLIDAGVRLPTQYMGMAVYFLGATVLVQIGLRKARNLLD